jgi:hypothetical protein
VAESSERRKEGLNKNDTFGGLSLAVLRVIAHPVNQSVEHEAIIEQTNRNECEQMHGDAIRTAQCKHWRTSRPLL